MPQCCVEVADVEFVNRHAYKDDQGKRIQLERLFAQSYRLVEAPGQPLDQTGVPMIGLSVIRAQLHRPPECDFRLVKFSRLP